MLKNNKKKFQMIRKSKPVAIFLAKKFDLMVIILKQKKTTSLKKSF